MSILNELSSYDAIALAGLIKQKEISSLELVEATIFHIEALNSKINAVVTKNYEEALQNSKSISLDSPFAGVPFLLKDSIASYQGLRLTLGSNLLKNYVPDHDSEIVKRYKNAGLIVIGKTNLCEFGSLPTTESQLFGPCRTPWDLNRNAGGSSGGSASAVAARIVPMASGSDGGGSLRVPASCCGVFGFKPTRARTPMGPDDSEILSGWLVQHAITRSVRDSAKLLDLTAGSEVGAPYAAPYQTSPYVDKTNIDPKKLRIAYSFETMNGTPVHEDCKTALQEAVKVCHELGHQMEEATPQYSGEFLMHSAKVLAFTEIAVVIDIMKELRGGEITQDEIEPHHWGFYERGKQLSAIDHLKVIQGVHSMIRQISYFFENYDMLLTPTLAKPPVVVSEIAPSQCGLDELLNRIFSFMPYTQIANATGQPAMSIPLYWNEDNLPIGVQFIGRFGDEETLFQLAAQLEKTKSWHDKKPPISI